MQLGMMRGHGMPQIHQCFGAPKVFDCGRYTAASCWTTVDIELKLGTITLPVQKTLVLMKGFSEKAGTVG